LELTSLSAGCWEGCRFDYQEDIADRERERAAGVEARRSLSPENEKAEEKS
jgi:hypothetical protein